MFQNKNHKLLDTTLASETLNRLSLKDKRGKTKISEIMEDFHENGILMAMIFFSLPVAIPLPYPPGFTTLMGIPLMFLSIQMIIGSTKVFLPNKINEYKIKNTTLHAISDKIVPILVFIEKYMKPRLSYAKSVYCEQFIGIICFVAASAVALPIPLTNAIPALGITIMSLGLLNRDGIIIPIGIIVAIVGLIIAFSVVFSGFFLIKLIFLKIFY